MDARPREHHFRGRESPWSRTPVGTRCSRGFLLGLESGVPLQPRRLRGFSSNLVISKGTTMSNTAPGYYRDAQGTLRWWDGQQWTEQTQDEPQRRSGIAEAAKRVVSQTKGTEEGVLWSAIGKPLTKIGGGRYRLTAEFLFFEKGTLSLKAQQIRTHEIHDVDASQSLAQKARGLGTITLFAERPSGREQVLLEDIENFREGVRIINEAAYAAREALRVRTQTQNVHYSGTPTFAAPPAPAPVEASPAPASVDLNAELGKLAEFHKSGVLSDEEFAAAKRKLLGL
jgi:hypothetical protein